MAIAKLDPLVLEIHGKVGGVVFRHAYGKTVVCAMPRHSWHKHSARRNAQIACFKAAVRNAKKVLADTQRKATYAQMAARAKQPLWSFVVGHFLRSDHKEADGSRGESRGAIG